MRKNPKTKIDPSTSKKPKIAQNPTGFYNQNPSWRISGMEMIDPYGWHTLDSEKLLQVKNKLASFESMTWQHILSSSNGAHHLVKITSLCTEAQSYLKKIKQDDVDELLSLRLTGRERVWGILDQGVLKLLWWDPEHQVCPSNLKHT